MRTVKEQIQKLETLKRGYDSSRPVDRMKKVYENGDVHVYTITTESKNSVVIQYVSSVHWSQAPVTIKYEIRFEGDIPEWDINYGSGGMLDVNSQLIAEAMQIMFSHAERQMKTKPNFS